MYSLEQASQLAFDKLVKLLSPMDICLYTNLPVYGNIKLAPLFHPLSQ